MSNKNFDLKILDLYWIDKDINNKSDLCAHGRVFVKIGDEVVSDKNSLDVSLSTAALYLMRTIKNDYKKGDYPSQLLPCCGNFMVADPKTSSVSIYGCPNGIDWAITHVGDKVKHVSENGQEALKILDSKERTFDLVVSDIEMPIMNGYEFAQICKKVERLSKIPLIAYTTRLTKDSVDRGYAAGFTEYLAKTDRDALLKAVKKHVSERAMA